MKVLILSCNTGEGHNSSAKALLKTMQDRGIECDKQDALALISEYVSRKTSDIYVYSTRANIFEPLYKFSTFMDDIHHDLHLQSPIYTSNKLYAKKLYDLIVNNKYDAVICTHFFPAEAMTAIRKKTGLKVPVVFINTDYLCLPFIEETDCDYYIIPHRHLIEECVAKGLPRERLVPYGLPCDEGTFGSRMPKDEARAKFNADYGWEPTAPDAKWYLVMGGSMGFGKVGDLVERLSDKADRVVCVCGSNKALLENLQKEFSLNPTVKPIGFSSEVSLLMDACDVLFTKPGGLTSTEAAIKNIPIVHMSPIPGVETANCRFFHYHDMSFYTEDIDEQVRMAHLLCTDPAVRATMLEGQRRNVNPHCCEDVVDLIQRAVQKRVS